MLKNQRCEAREALWGLRSLLLVVLTLMLAGCGDDSGLIARFLLKTEQIIVERRPDPVYDQLFPYYVELCTISQFSRKDGRRGNPFGHALLYIKGACKDENAPFPQLRRCHRVATALDDPEHGAGVSVGRWLRNVNWVAIPGHELVFSGNLKPDERLTQDHFDATVRQAIDLGVYQGVELHPGWKSSENSTLEEYVANHSITADFALQFARNVFCARIPVTEPVLNEVIAFLNDKNQEYATGKADYNWSLLANNCVHTVRNALAAANMWSPVSVLGIKIRHLFRLAVPANEFVNLAALGTEGPVDDYQQIQAEGALRDALHDFRWLPTRQGALLKTLPVHEPNDIYNSQFRLFAVQSPLSMGTTANAVRLLSDPRYVDLKSNLLYFRDKYDAILAAHDYSIDRLASVSWNALPAGRASALRLHPGPAAGCSRYVGSALEA
ncbi:MAG: hypothetical protein IPK78_21270 [Rhodospirillales bacterium]|nr:hypothetical protein [Rhodospirillales bacterium]